jgi:flavin-dependent dehydrogenase
MTHFDCIIVGAGPAGSTTAFYLTEGARRARRPVPSVGLLEKAQFPRDKFCGDAWCAPALDILEDMQVLQRLQARGVVSETLSGGFVSPSGYSFIANDRGKTDVSELDQTARACAIKRAICDEAIARRAVEVGAVLVENALVDVCTLDEQARMWTVRVGDGRAFTCRVLVCCDGAASNVARKLGIVQTAPDGVAARQYIQGGTHNFKADGVLLYPEYTLPGYMALFRHYDDSIDLGAYLLPGGAATDEDIADIYENKITTDPFISRALGPNWKPLERVKVASLRLGGVPQVRGPGGGC